MRLRYSLATLLVLTALTGILLAAWVGYIRPIRRQWRAAELLLDRGAVVDVTSSGLPTWMTWALPRDQRDYIVSVDWKRNKLDDEAVAALAELPHLRRLYLQRSNVRDAHLEHVARLKTLQRLALWGNSGITDAGIAHLANLPEIRVVDISDTRATWRSRLHFQGRAVKVVQRNYYQSYQAEPHEVQRLADLRLPVLKLLASNSSDHEIERSLRLFPNLERWQFTLAGMFGAQGKDVSEPLFSERGLEALRQAELRKLTIYFDPVKHIELLHEVLRVFAPHSDQLAIHVHGDLTEIHLEPVLMRCFGSPSGEVFASLPHLDSLQFLSLTGNYEPMHLRVVEATSGIGTLRLGIGLAGPVDMSGLSRLRKLQHLELHGPTWRSDGSQARSVFSALRCEQTLREVTLTSLDLTPEELSPLLKFSSLERINVQRASRIVGDLLPSLREK